MNRLSGPPSDAPLDPSSLAASLDTVLRGRRSVRHYRSTVVPAADIQAVLAAATWAPSPHHSAPWRFVVLTRLPAKRRFATAMGAAWQKDLEGDGLPAERIARLLTRSYERITRAPVAIIFCMTEARFDSYPDARRQEAERIMAAHSVGAALQNAMLTAYARGLATCWMCAPLFCPDTVVAAMSLEPTLRPQALLTLGYAAEPLPPHPPRLAPELIAHWH
jgi:F420 biosynthesis protein FbiB-like protein